jgi:hypothetical protein
MQNNFKNNLLEQTIKTERLRKKQIESFLIKAQVGARQPFQPDRANHPISAKSKLEANPTINSLFRLNHNKNK